MVSALTYSFKGIRSEIITDVNVKNALGNETVITKGLWDTGAQNSAITADTARKLGLKAISKTKVRGVHGVKEVNVYAIEIVLNNPDITLRCPATECDELSNDGTVGILLGMSVISKGDFFITNYEGNTTMTFRVPSLQRIDFVAEIDEFKRIMKIHDIESKRGIEKCPCKSGKSFKNCHGKSIYFK